MTPEPECRSPLGSFAAHSWDIPGDDCDDCGGNRCLIRCVDCGLEDKACDE